MTASNSERFDLGTIFPPKGDPRRPPEWLSRALLETIIAVFIAWFVFTSWGKIEFLVLDIIVSMFIALGIEPMVIRLVRHGWRRGAATAMVMILLIVFTVGLLTLFGNMFIQQMIAMINGLPQLYDEISRAVAARTPWRLPAMQDLGGQIFSNIESSWVTNIADQAIATTLSAVTFLFNLMTVLLVTYYISAAGPKMRRSMCKWINPVSQNRFLVVWGVAQEQISNFLFSRSILALISSAFTSVFLVIMHVPYWLPLALFCGLTAQFVPTVGTYLGGALPIVFAWGNNGLWTAVAVLVFIIVYQQVENLVFAPKISERTMDLNPAIAFLVVLLFGAVFGALGAFLALPLAASIQTIFTLYTRRYALIDSPLMNDPKPKRKSKVVEGAEAFNEHVIKPVASRMPRAVRGSSTRVHVSGESGSPGEDGQPDDTWKDTDSATVAIPKRAKRDDTDSARDSGDRRR